jgi:hypothetical protein
MARKRPYDLKGIAWDLRATWLLDDWFMKTAGWMKGPEEKGLVAILEMIASPQSPCDKILWELTTHERYEAA